MNQSFAITRTLFVVALIAALVAAGIALRSQQQSSEGLERASQEGLFWSAVQVEVELSRLAATLGRLAIGDESVTPEQVNERFDVLWSRVALFRHGEVGERLARLDTNDVVGQLFAEMQRHEPAIVTIGEQDEATIRRIIADLITFSDALRALSIRVIRAEERRFADVRENVRSSSSLALITTATVLALGVLLVGLLLYESRRYRQLAEESGRLAERAEAASRVKSRFLTMMSHELRTPMNGVMGMLALVRQTHLSEAQDRLVEQAQRSGSRMVTLLGDMLDLSDLQSERQRLKSSSFSLAGLSAELQRDLAPRSELAFAAEIDPAAPERLTGDFARLRQALRHLVGHMVEIVGSSEVTLRFAHDGHNLRVEIDAALHEGEATGWSPEDMLRGAQQDYGEFASDTLAPVIAKGLIEFMDGDVEVKRTRPGRASVVVRIPMMPVHGARRALHVDVESQALAAVIDALARSEGWRVVESAQAGGQIGAVLFSSDGRDEPTEVARLRRIFPTARIVAVGTPLHPRLFDAICHLPVTRRSLIEAIDAPERDSTAVS